MKEFCAGEIKGLSRGTFTLYSAHMASPVAQMVKNYLQCGRPGFDPWVWKIRWRRKQQPTLVFLPGKPHGESRLVGYNPWGHKELDRTEQLTQCLYMYVLKKQI